ncbi:hypothetical protein DPEC_G00119900 [Dallia pectoralis]|uniref:Uncharacterized protein n=1 Tax=Dallia pectoralis TaxID=75939 RepID=A0ACC2GPQ4_DALPE|nr:hypothetical protein DPEC_G00119900 [Dallia pectoralis]
MRTRGSTALRIPAKRRRDERRDQTKISTESRRNESVSLSQCGGDRRGCLYRVCSIDQPLPPVTIWALARCSSCKKLSAPFSQLSLFMEPNIARQRAARPGIFLFDGKV